MYLIQNIDVFAPRHVGTKDIFLGGSKILAMEDDLSGVIEAFSDDKLNVIDGSGNVAVPGLIDNHLHLIGGGGEGGFSTRTPEMQFEDIISAGVTSVVGTLGTDGTTRSMAALLAKVKGLKEQGLSSWCYTGSYHLPLKTVTGKLSDDIILIEEIVGAGEIAIADHRSSQPGAEELARLASQARVGGMISGKAGTLNIHTGSGRGRITLLEDVIENSDIPRSQFVPTHMGRNEELFHAGLNWALAGGYVDFTSCTTPEFIDEGEIRCSRALKRLLDRGVKLDRISFSSDAGGSLPSFDETGNLTGMVIGSCRSLMDEVRLAVNHEGIDLATAIAPVTINPARRLKLHGKGELAPGMDGDLLILDRSDLRIETVFANAQLLYEETRFT